MNQDVLFVSPTMGADTDPLYWGPILSALVAKGMPVRLLVGHELNQSKLPGCSLAPSMRSWQFMGFRIPSWLQIYAEIRALRGVCIVNEFGPSSVLAILACRVLGNRPTVLLVENHDKFLARNQIHRRGFALVERRILAWLASVVLTNNECGRAYAAEALSVRKRKLRVGPYLTSILARSEAQHSRPFAPTLGREIAFVAVGRLVKSKGFENMVREIALVPADVRTRIRVSIFGDGPDRSSLKAAIALAQLGHCVRLEGRVEYATLGDRIAGFDCFLMPTLADYRSLSSFEAIGLGLPVLMSVHDGAISEVLEDGVNGFSFDPEVEGSLAAAIAHMCAALDAGRPFGRESARIAANFTIERAASVLMSAVAAAVDA